MIPILHVIVVALAMLLAFRLVSAYFGGHYVCPSCGARSADRHSRNCPWTH